MVFRKRMLSYDVTREWPRALAKRLPLVVCLAWAGCSDPQINEPKQGDLDDTVAADASAARASVDGATASDARTSLANARDGARSEVANAEVDAAVGAPDIADASSASGPDAVTSANDASAQAAGFPSWVDELPGRYAARVLSFSSDSNGVLSNRRAIYFVDISSQPDGYEMKLQYCELVAQNFAGTMTLIKPTKLPPLRHRMLFAADSFSTEPLEWEQGYERNAPENCANRKGELVAKRPFQTWIPATRHDASLCRCPGPLLPEIDDCRVIDPDEDGRPGFTLELKTIGGIGDTKVFGVNSSYSRYIDGHRDADGVLRSRLETKETALQYDCDPSGCANLSGPLPSCGAAASTVEFVPLERRETPTSGWSCEAIMARTGVLFPTAEPAPPQNCRG